jgi:hypothetical protein
VNIKLYLMGLVLLMVGCNSSPMPLSSGIEGQVFIGPMCPVMQVGKPCPDQPYQTMLSVVRSNGQKVARFQTEADGTFHQALAPGDYILRPESSGVMPYAKEQPFLVQPNQYTRLIVKFDSGIR